MVEPGGRMARATASTPVAPARFGVRAQALIVAPVVMTSSTRRTRRPVIRSSGASREAESPGDVGAALGVRQADLAAGGPGSA
jgi:hypothetical protein